MRSNLGSTSNIFKREKIRGGKTWAIIDQAAKGKGLGPSAKSRVPNYHFTRVPNRVISSSNFHMLSEGHQLLRWKAGIAALPLCSLILLTFLIECYTEVGRSPEEPSKKNTKNNPGLLFATIWQFGLGTQTQRKRKTFPFSHYGIFQVKNTWAITN